MWNKRYAEAWTAFAPNVTKLLENIEYVEKEDEFDLVTRGHHRQGCQLCRVCMCSLLHSYSSIAWQAGHRGAGASVHRQ